MNIERIWMFATGAVLLPGLLLTALDHTGVYAGLSDVGRRILVAGLVLAFLPLLIGIGWFLWEKIARCKAATGGHIT